jgi:delta8-fatty-acid desaturase
MEKKKYTREEIAQRIVDHGDLLVIYSNKIYRLNSWIKHHPGGEMVILHMIGKVRLKKILKLKIKKIKF